MATVTSEIASATLSITEMSPAPKREYPGALVVVEGIDGSGKSTQLYLLKRWLGDRRVPDSFHGVEFFAAGQVRDPARQAAAPVDSHDIFVVTRGRLRGSLRAADPAAAAGRLSVPVLADRYIYTAFARDVARGCSPHWLRNLYSFAPVPDITIYFRAPLEVAVNRIVAGRPKLKYYEAGMDLGISLDRAESFRIFQERILSNYDQMVQTDHFVLMDGTMRVNQLQKQMRRIVTRTGESRRRSPRKRNEADQKNSGAGGDCAEWRIPETRERKREREERQARKERASRGIPALLWDASARSEPR